MNHFTTYIIESPSGEKHKLEIRKEGGCYWVIVDDTIDDTTITKEELLKELSAPSF